MQSRYGVSEFPQFMAAADGMCSGNPLFSISPAADSQQHPQHHHHQQHQNPPQQFHHYHQFPDLHHHQQPPPPQQHQPIPPRFPYFHSIPITQQLFEQQTNQFHFFQQEQQRRLQHHHLGLDDDPADAAPDNIPNSSGRILGGGGGSDVGGGSGGGGDHAPLFLGQAMNFRLAVDETCSGARGEHNDDGLMRGGGGCDAPESNHLQLHRWPPASPPHQREEESEAIKEPFWRPLDIDYINRNNKRPKEQQQQYQHLEGSSNNKHFRETKTGNDADDGTTSGTSDHNNKLFSELEAICQQPGSSAPATATATHHQTGSSSALTGETPIPLGQVSGGAGACYYPDSANHEAGAGNISDNSAGEEELAPAAAKMSEDNNSSSSTRIKNVERKKKKKMRKQQLKSIGPFFERLVKQLMEHQELLHGKFLEVLEKRDREKTRKEEDWRKQEAAKLRAETNAREEQQAVASAREAAIISYLEKITGESLNLPPKPRQTCQEEEEEEKEEERKANNNMEGYPLPQHNSIHDVDDRVLIYPNRWPRAEVEALIKVRSGFESRFQEPGLKGPLWEEVSSAMAARGYRRSAKRCKEKWENINKYFRKTKESARKRPQNSKTCPYFHQLDQLYGNKVDAAAAERKGAGGCNSELLDAVVVSTDRSCSAVGGKGMVELQAGGSEYDMMEEVQEEEGLKEGGAGGESQ